MTITLSDNDIEFLAARVRRLLKAFDYPATEGLDDEAVVRVVGTLIGGLLLHIESEKPIAWAAWPGVSRSSGQEPILSLHEPMAHPQRVPLMRQPPKPKMFRPQPSGD